MIYPSDFAGASVAYSGTAGSTATFPPQPRVLVWTTTDAYIKVGEGVTATTNDFPIPAATPVILYAPPGSGAAWRVSAIQIGAAGTVYAKPIA